MEKYLIETFGCQMNIHDSEKIAGMLRTLGYEETLDKEQADIIVFNTCCIRESAELKILSKIGDIKSLKKKKKDLIVVVCGCMTQQKQRAEFIKEKYPYVNIIIGTHNIEELEEYIKTFKINHKKNVQVWDKEREVKEFTKAYRTSKYNAWVNIMFGCNNFCTYCIVPYVRGRERSRSVESIVQEVKSLVETHKYRTITLLGQNVNSYGKDFNDGITNFVYLLDKLCQIDGEFTLKFMTSHPKDFSYELINFITTHDKMSKALHLPVQSGSNDVLKRMNRSYTIEHYKDLVTKIYERIPDATLTTDIIVGFPGESEEDFNKTLDLIKFCNYSGVFGFVYSKRHGTPAEKFPDQVDAKTKQKRITKLFEVQHEILKRQLSEMVGRIYNVYVEENLGKCLLLCKTDNGKSIRINGSYEVGTPLKVKVEKIDNNELYGIVVED